MPAKKIHNIVVRNGSCEGGLQRTVDGAAYGSLKAAATEFGSRIAAVFPEMELPGDGAFIHIPEGVAAGGFSLHSIFENEGAVNTVCIVIAEKDSSAEVFYELHNTAGTSARDGLKIYAGPGARVSAEEILLDDGGAVFEGYAVQHSDSTLDAVTVVLGNGDTSVSYKRDLLGPECDSNHAALFMAGGQEKKAFNVRVNHMVPDCRSDVTVRGVASDNATGNFTGMVYVAQDAQHTQAYQQSRNLVLKDTAQILTSPQLEIYADDVKCSHGATVGQIDGEAVYYMRQRGLSEEQARRLQLVGFMNDIVMRISDETRRGEVLALAEAKI